MSDTHATSSIVRRIWIGVLTTDRFVRLHQLFFSAIWPLLGAASVRRDLTAAELAGLVAVMLCFHVYAYVLNDVIDLPLDRTQPQRQDDLLVRGVISTTHALLIALVQPLLTIPLTMRLGGSLQAHATLAAGFALMGAYNIWGKRCPFPPLTDAIQGLAWGSLAIYAAYAIGAEPNALTWMVTGWVTAFALFFNGVHGSLRDLGNDFVRGARTTAIFLGARPADANGDAYIPRELALFASAVLALLIGMTGVIILRNDFDYDLVAWTATAIAVGALSLLAIILHPQVVHPRGGAWDSAWRLQLYVLAVTLPVAFIAHASIAVSLVLLSLNLLALVLFGCTAVVGRWAWLAFQSAFRVASSGRVTWRSEV